MPSSTFHFIPSELNSNGLLSISISISISTQSSLSLSQLSPHNPHTTPLIMTTHSHSSHIRTDSDFRTHAPYAHRARRNVHSPPKHRLGPIVQITAIDSDSDSNLQFDIPHHASSPIRRFANPGPLGLSAFALNTFILSLVHVRARGLQETSIVIGAAYAYGGLVQLLAGMWYVLPSSPLQVLFAAFSSSRERQKGV
jgi:hypothetical protein